LNFQFTAVGGRPGIGKSLYQYLIGEIANLGEGDLTGTVMGGLCNKGGQKSGN
jgi:hypothetical protein